MFGALRIANRELGVTIVVVTHDPLVATQVDRTVAIRDGRTASEVVRRTAISEHGHEEVIAEEYAVLDRAGRVQLPRDFVNALSFHAGSDSNSRRTTSALWPGAAAAASRRQE